MATYNQNGHTYTNDGKTIRAIAGYNQVRNRPTSVQQDSGLGWYSCRLVRATGSTWRIEWANGEQVEVSPRTVRMCIGDDLTSA